MWWWDDGDKARLKRIERKVDKIMSTVEELNALYGEISTELDKVSADTDNLLAALAAIPPGGVPPEVQAGIDAAVVSATAIRDRLKALDDKVPEPTPPTT